MIWSNFPDRNQDRPKFIFKSCLVMVKSLFQELQSNNIVFVPSECISTFLCFCLVRKNCRPNGGEITPDGQYFYIG